MQSVWFKNSGINSFPALSGDKKADTVVVGGGIAGILCAYKLTQCGVNCILLEADRICRGVTGFTTAKITSQHGFIYQKLIKKFGTEKAGMYLNANEKALAEYKSLSEKYHCDFEIRDNVVYTLKSRDRAEKEMNALNKLSFKAEFTDKIHVPFEIEGAVRFKNQAQFNPLKLLSQLSKGLSIYENTKVFEIRDNCAYTAGGKVRADRFIIATHFPFMNKQGGYFLKLFQERSYVLALENGINIDGMYVDEAQKGMSFRNYGEYLLIGGGDHRTGKQGGNYTELRTFAKTNYPDCTEKYHWATQDCMSLDGVPYIGRYSKSLPNIYVATGFNKWGMTSGMVSAQILSDMILERQNDYAEVFSPSRSMLTPQLAVNGGEAVANLLTISKKRCPHMGCALKWNSSEHTWDCPCHGSRFTENGKLINNPATDDLKNLR